MVELSIHRRPRAAAIWLDVPAALGLFDDDPTIAQLQYQQFVLAKMESSECLWDNVVNGIYLGTECWAKRMRTIVESRPRSTDHPLSQRAVGRPKMATIVATVARAASKDLVRNVPQGIWSVPRKACSIGVGRSSMNGLNGSTARHRRKSISSS